MKRKIIFYSLVFILFCFIDTVFVPVKIYGVGPCFLLAATVCISMVEKERFGTIYGLIFGLFLDFSTASVFGVNALIFMAVGFLTGIISRQKISVSVFGAFFLTTVSAVATEFLKCCCYSFFLTEPITDTLLYIMLPGVLLTLPTVFITYPVIRLINKLTTRYEERSGTW